MEPDDRRVREIVVAVAAALREQLPSVAQDIERVITDAIPGFASDDVAAIRTGIGDNVDVALRVLTDGSRLNAPASAIHDAQRFAQRGVPAVLLIRAYRVGQARFLELCIDQLLRQAGDEHAEVRATRAMVAAASEYIDHVVEEVVTAYEESHDAWVHDRSAVLAMRVREVLRGGRVDVAATERALDYRFDGSHQALVLWVDEPDVDAHVRIRRVVGQIDAAHARSGTPLLVPRDESTAWAWLPTPTSVVGSSELQVAAKDEPSVAVAIGEPAPGIDGFRKSHRQATAAQTVAFAAREHRAQLTPFVEVAPIAMLCSDLDSARDWIHDTLGDLAIDTSRNEGLRETARVFLQSGGSYTATAEQLFLHRNTAQYRVRKAEEVRGRPLREARLDVELALLACRWLKGAVLQPA